MIKRIYNRPGSRGHRNSEELGSGSEIDSSGHKIREVHPTDKAPKKFESRGQLERTGQKRPRSQSETRDSSREPSRGRAEFTGRMNKRVNVRNTNTAAKSGRFAAPALKNNRNAGSRGATSPSSRSRTSSRGK